MSDKPDNHIDGTIRKILMDVANDYSNSVNPELDGTLYTGPDLKSAKQQLDQYYADFYRNKILEAVKYGWDASGEGWNAEYTGSSKNNPDKVREDLALEYLATITAQFNSKEE